MQGWFAAPEFAVREKRLMPHTNILRQVSLLASLVLAFMIFTALAGFVSAQEGGSRAAQASSQSPPIRHASAAPLTAEQARGAGLFFQRCSLCHLAKTSGAGGSKYCCVASLGPDLSDRFKNLSAEQEEAFKAIILNGGPTYMPAWKYGLTADEIDEIIAYLKTLG
jgi:mono/diheme cytochrome c family protein